MRGESLQVVGNLFVMIVILAKSTYVAGSRGVTSSSKTANGRERERGEQRVEQAVPRGRTRTDACSPAALNLPPRVVPAPRRAPRETADRQAMTDSGQIGQAKIMSVWKLRMRRPHPSLLSVARANPFRVI